MLPTRYVTYFRVSTKKQGDSGLGLEAQQRDIDIFLERYSDQPFEVIQAFTDIESGKSDARPSLQAAIALAKKEKATLLVAKLDRLSRDVEFIAGIIKRCDLKVACMPNADRFQLHLYAALAEQEREFISQRTKQALQAAKARGIVLGSAGRLNLQRNISERRACANAFAANLATTIKGFCAAGLSQRQMVVQLNNLQIQAPRGGSCWSLSQLQRLIKRIENI